VPDGAAVRDRGAALAVGRGPDAALPRARAALRGPASAAARPRHAFVERGACRALGDGDRAGDRANGPSPGGRRRADACFRPGRIVVGDLLPPPDGADRGAAAGRAACGRSAESTARRAACGNSAKSAPSPADAARDCEPAPAILVRPFFACGDPAAAASGPGAAAAAERASGHAEDRRTACRGSGDHAARRGCSARDGTRGAVQSRTAPGEGAVTRFAAA